MNRLRDQQGQTLVLTTLFVVAFLGMTAFVIDLGSWFREQRDTQAGADAATLAGAQALPHDPAKARADAETYAAKNGGGEVTVSFRTTTAGVDTIAVKVRRDTPGFFAKVFGIDTVKVGAKAAAKASRPGAVRWVAPIAVSHLHPNLNCNPQPCLGSSYITQIELENLHKPGDGTAAGSFALISLNDQDLDANTLAEWLLNGYNEYMGLSSEVGDYRVAPSANFNNGQFQSALEKRKGTEMLFPVYKKITGSGATAEFEIIGWVGFVVLKVIGGGANQTLEGYFARVVWDALPATGGSPSDFGVRTIELIE